MNKFKFHIQLFAGDEPILNPNGTNSPGLSEENKTFYDRALLEEAGPNLIHAQFGQKRPIPKSGGKRIQFRKYAALPKALKPLTEGITPSGRSLNVTAVEAEVNQYGDYVTLTDVLDLTAIDNNVLEATKAIGRQAGLTLDTITRNVLHSGTNVYYCPHIDPATGAKTAINDRAELDGSCPLTVDVVKRVAAILKAANAPKINGNYVAIIHPLASYDLMSDEHWEEMNKYTTPEAQFEGEIGRIAGVRFIESSEAMVHLGADLASDSATLLVNKSGGYSGVISSIAFDGGTVAADALVGREINIGGVSAMVTANTANTLTIDPTDFGTVADNAVIYPGEGGKEGVAVFGTLFIADGAYGVTEVAGGGLKTIIKQLGSAGTGDPLDQRSTVGWKALQTAEILMEPYMIRVESTSAMDDSAKAN